MHCSWELNKKKYYFTPFFIKIIFLFSFLFSSYSSLSLSHITSLYSLKPKLLSLSSHRLGPALTCRWSCPYLCKSHPCCCPWIHLAQSSTLPTHLPMPPTHLAQSISLLTQHQSKLHCRLELHHWPKLHRWSKLHCWPKLHRRLKPSFPPCMSSDFSVGWLGYGWVYG